MEHVAANSIQHDPHGESLVGLVDRCKLIDEGYWLPHDASGLRRRHEARP